MAGSIDNRKGDKLQLETEVITFNLVEGFHQWGGAPDQVAFLRHRHRHTFHIRCAFPVLHNDREKEIFIQQWKIQDHIAARWGTPAEFQNLSCESIAEALLKDLGCSWVEVLEDGQGGAKVLKKAN